MTRSIATLGALGLVLTMMVACSSSSAPDAALPGHCAPLSGARIADLLGEYPLDLLSEDVREDLGEALRGVSRICLVADGESVQCNAGGGPKPDIRRCCRFRDEPRAKIFGVARRIGVSRGGEQVLDLAVEPNLENASLDRQCDVPTCADDRASADATLTLRGTVQTKDRSVEFELPVALDGRLALACDG
ncbi:MAG: hypothetical protein P8R42_24970 [Candidatus Binatia bacterium]|nr:hypothetical protein [Candidatus Binatia bacterium]